MFFRKRLKQYDKEEERKKMEEIENAGGLEKKDMPAMILSALFTIVPVCLLVLLGISFLALWAFGML